MELEGSPSILLPPNLSDLKTDNLEGTIQRCRHLFSSQEELNWWSSFISDMKYSSATHEQLQEYADEEAIWLLPLLPKLKTTADEENVFLPQHVQDILDRQFDRPVVRYFFT